VKRANVELKAGYRIIYQVEELNMRIGHNGQC